MTKQNDDKLKKETLEYLDELEQRGENSCGFTVGGAPIWLYRYLHIEAEAYKGLYWPVLVEKIKKAEAYDEMRLASLPEQKTHEEIDEEPKAEGIPTFGGNVATKR